MKKLLALSALVLATSATSAFANVPADAKYGGSCAYHLAAKGEMVKTDCKVTWKDAKEGKTYCFAAEKDKTEFAKDIEKHKKMAEDAFAKNHGGEAKKMEGEPAHH